MENKNTNQVAGGFTLVVRDAGNNSHRVIQIRDAAGARVADFVSCNRHSPLAMYPGEVELARKVLAMLNS